MTPLEANKKMVDDVASLELDVAAIFEKKLQVFGVETKLGHRLADGVRRRPVGGWASPSVRASCVFECQVTAVIEEDRCLCELGVRDIACRMFPGEI
jgi:hypothetical protein